VLLVCNISWEAYFLNSETKCLTAVGLWKTRLVHFSSYFLLWYGFNRGKLYSWTRDPALVLEIWHLQLLANFISWWNIRFSGRRGLLFFLCTDHGFRLGPVLLQSKSLFPIWFLYSNKSIGFCTCIFIMSGVFPPSSWSFWELHNNTTPSTTFIEGRMRRKRWNGRENERKEEKWINE
jgi:hypothetical protein